MNINITILSSLSLSLSLSPSPSPSLSLSLSLPQRRNNVSISIVNDSIDDEVLQEETLVVNEYNILDAPVIISRLRKEVNDCMHTRTCMHYALACK